MAIELQMSENLCVAVLREFEVLSRACSLSEKMFAWLYILCSTVLGWMFVLLLWALSII